MEEEDLHAKWASEPRWQQHLVKCPLSNTHTHTHTHTLTTGVIPTPIKAVHLSRPLDRWKTGGQGAEGSADLRQLYYITGWTW